MTARERMEHHSAALDALGFPDPHDPAQLAAIEAALAEWSQARREWVRESIQTKEVMSNGK